jgi:hypothetical protein
MEKVNYTTTNEVMLYRILLYRKATSMLLCVNVQVVKYLLDVLIAPVSRLERRINE